MCVDQRCTDCTRINFAKSREFLRYVSGRVSGDLDRKRLRSWIALVALTAFVMVVAACSAQEDGAARDDSALGAKGRWSPPADVLATGAKVRIAYEDAPKWTGTAACGGALKPGGHKLGEYLLDHFAEVASVGGYACRRNTADSSRMSVHGTGRALDVFIPTSNGGADNAKGDKVANWLVLHAQRIGVQLVIWDRSIWRANGTNDAAYGGPVPHIDHIHVELTNLASALQTPWFSDMSDVPDASSTTDGGSGNDATTDDTVDAGDTADGGVSTDDAGTTGTTGAASPDAGTKKDASVVDPSNDDGAQDAPDADVAASPSAVSADPAAAGGSDGVSSAGDEPGETDSLPDVPASKHRSTSATDANGDPVPNAGCSTAPIGGSPIHGSTGAGVVGLAFAFAAWLRRKR
jgi:hypothetical protein